MHTMAKVKNASWPTTTYRSRGPADREEQVVESADGLIANTIAEARQLIDLYDAAPTRSRWSPGVDLAVFARGPGGGPAGRRAAGGAPSCSPSSAAAAAEGPDC
jgi:D-inositol-3-phosphate glycosyltransferase